jgi:hypothetical protein
MESMLNLLYSNFITNQKLYIKLEEFTKKLLKKDLDIIKEIKLLLKANINTYPFLSNIIKCIDELVSISNKNADEIIKLKTYKRKYRKKLLKQKNKLLSVETHKNAEIQTLTKDNQTLTNENKTLTNENKTLTNENKTLTNENKTLTNDNQTLTKENERLNKLKTITAVETGKSIKLTLE